VDSLFWLIFGSEEYESMVEASLDGWVTEGKYTEMFENALSKYLGVHYTSFVNSGSSANLIAISALTSNYLKEIVFAFCLKVP